MGWSVVQANSAAWGGFVGSSLISFFFLAADFCARCVAKIGSSMKMSWRPPGCSRVNEPVVVLSAIGHNTIL